MEIWITVRSENLEGCHSPKSLGVPYVVLEVDFGVDLIRCLIVGGSASAKIVGCTTYGFEWSKQNFISQLFENWEAGIRGNRWVYHILIQMR